MDMRIVTYACVPTSSDKEGIMVTLAGSVLKVLCWFFFGKMFDTGLRSAGSKYHAIFLRMLLTEKLGFISGTN